MVSVTFSMLNFFSLLTGIMFAVPVFNCDAIFKTLLLICDFDILSLLVAIITNGIVLKLKKLTICMSLSFGKCLMSISTKHNFNFEELSK